jgi:hypothetical protein
MGDTNVRKTKDKKKRFRVNQSVLKLKQCSVFVLETVLVNPIMNLLIKVTLKWQKILLYQKCSSYMSRSMGHLYLEIVERFAPR